MSTPRALPQGYRFAVTEVNLYGEIGTVIRAHLFYDPTPDLPIPYSLNDVVESIEVKSWSTWEWGKWRQNMIMKSAVRAAHQHIQKRKQDQLKAERFAERLKEVYTIMHGSQ